MLYKFVTEVKELAMLCILVLAFWSFLEVAWAWLEAWL